MSVQPWKWARWRVCAAPSSERWCFPLPCLAAAAWIFQQHLKYSIKNSPETLGKQILEQPVTAQGQNLMVLWQKGTFPHPDSCRAEGRHRCTFIFPSTTSIFGGKDRMARGIMDFCNPLSLHPTISCSAEVYQHSRHWFHCMNLSGGLINVRFTLLYLFLSLALCCWCSWLSALVFEEYG